MRVKSWIEKKRLEKGEKKNTEDTERERENVQQEKGNEKKQAGHAVQWRKRETRY